MKVLQTFALPLGDRAPSKRQNQTIIAEEAAGFLADAVLARRLLTEQPLLISVLTDCLEKKRRQEWLRHERVVRANGQV